MCFNVNNDVVKSIFLFNNILKLFFLFLILIY